MPRGLPLRFLTMHFFRCATEGSPMHEGAAIDPLLVRTPEGLPMSLRQSRHAGVYAQRLAAGHVAVLLLCDDDVMHVSWIARTSLRVDELGCTLRLPADAVCVYDVVTTDAWRGRGVYPAVLGWIRRHGREQFSAGSIWIYCEQENVPSLRGIEKAGYEPVGRRRAVVLAGRWRWSWGRINGDVTCS